MKRFLNFRFLLLFALMLSLSFTNADAQRRRSRSSSSSVRIVTSSNTISQAGRYLLDGDYYVGIIKREGGYTNIRVTPNGRIVAKIKDGSKIVAYMGKAAKDFPVERV